MVHKWDSDVLPFMHQYFSRSFSWNLFRANRLALSVNFNGLFCTTPYSFMPPTEIFTKFLPIQSPKVTPSKTFVLMVGADLPPPIV